MTEKKIYCPQCNRQVATHDGKSVSNIEVRCKKCKVLVVYRPSNGETVTTNIPKRVSASGKRFY